MNPKYPIYIVSKGRSESRLTSKALEEMNVNYYIIVEEQEYDDYAKVINPNKILILPQPYLYYYDTFDKLDNSIKSKGPGAARNFAWDHSIWFGNRNIKAEVSSGTIFKCMEDFTERYENVAISGPNYYSFCKTTDSVSPFTLNTRIYSCLLIKNNIPYRWRGRYNEDTDLSIRVLKDGYCTILFNAFLCGKVTTQRMKGGNTKEFYEHEGTKAKSQMLEDMHPDIAKVVWKFNRWHHHVDYKVFKNNSLVMKKDIVVDEKINNYGLKLIKIDK